jgi:hypothetical protein
MEGKDRISLGSFQVHKVIQNSFGIFCTNCGK